MLRKKELEALVEEAERQKASAAISWRQLCQQVMSIDVS